MLNDIKAIVEKNIRTMGIKKAFPHKIVGKNPFFFLEGREESSALPLWKCCYYNKDGNEVLRFNLKFNIRLRIHENNKNNEDNFKGYDIKIIL